jgi:hypothetical protein
MTITILIITIIQIISTDTKKGGGHVLRVVSNTYNNDYVDGGRPQHCTFHR